MVRTYENLPSQHDEQTQVVLAQSIASREDVVSSNRVSPARRIAADTVVVTSTFVTSDFLKRQRVTNVVVEATVLNSVVTAVVVKTRDRPAREVENSNLSDETCAKLTQISQQVASTVKKTS